MASDDIIEALKASALQIRDEKQAGANTAMRVGSLLLAICEAHGVILNEFEQNQKKLDRLFFERLFAAVDENGNEILPFDLTTPVSFIKVRYNTVVEGGITMYANGGMLDLPSIYAGLPIDNQTICWEDILDKDGNKIGQRLVARVVGEGGEVVATMLGDLTNVGSWANEIAKSDRVLFQQNGTTSWVGLSTEDLVKKYAYTKKEADEFLEKKWTKDDELIEQWNTAYKWGNHAGQGYLKEDNISGRYLKLAGGTMNKDSSIISGFIYPLEDDKYALGLLNRAYGYVYSHRYFVDDLVIKKSQDDVIFVDANLVVRGGITMYSTDGTTAPSIWDGAPVADTRGGKGVASFDPNYFTVDNGVVKFIGQTGGGIESITKQMVLEALGYTPYNSTNPNGYITSSGSITGNAATASKLLHKVVYPSMQYSRRYCKFATLSLNGRYVAKRIRCKLSVETSTNSGFGYSCEVYCQMYQQNAMGNLPAYTLISDVLPESILSIYGVLNYNSSSSSIDLFVSVNQAYAMVDGITLEGENLLPNNSESSASTTLPSGIVIRPNLDGYVARASQLNGLFSVKKGGVTNLLTNGNSVGMSNGYNFASYNYSDDVYQYTTDSNGKVIHDGMYTLTICGKLGADNTYISAFWDGGTSNYTVINGLSSTEERIVSITAKITKKNTLTFYQYPQGVYGSYIKWAILEKAENVTEEGGAYLCNARRIDFTPGTNNRRMIVDGGVSMIRHFAPTTGSATPGFSFHTNYGGTLGWMGAGIANNVLEYYGIGFSATDPVVKIDTSGNLLTKGGITMYSDIRKKTILNHVELSLKEVADAPLIEHYYNSDEKKVTHVGSVAQYWVKLNNWFCKEDGEGFLTMEIQNAALASAISVARELTRYESKTDKQIKKLKKRIGELEEEIENLKNK